MYLYIICIPDSFESSYEHMRAMKSDEPLSNDDILQKIEHMVYPKSDYWLDTFWHLIYEKNTNFDKLENNYQNIEEIRFVILRFDNDGNMKIYNKRF